MHIEGLPTAYHVTHPRPLALCCGHAHCRSSSLPGVAGSRDAAINQNSACHARHSI